MTILSNNYTYNHTFNNFFYDLTKNHDLLVTANSIDNYTDIIESLGSNIRDMALKMLQDKYESLHENFFNSTQRKRNYRVKSKAVAPLLRSLVKLPTLVESMNQRLMGHTIQAGSKSKAVARHSVLLEGFKKEGNRFYISYTKIFKQLTSVTHSKPRQ